MRASWFAVVAVAAAAPAYADSSHGYIEKFVGWSKDGTFFVITEAGTDEVDLPALCVSKRGDKPQAWPKDIPPPDDDRGCTATLDQVFEGQDARALVAKATSFVVAPGKARHGETIALHKVGDGSIVEVTVAGKKPLGKGYFFLRDKSFPLPPNTSTIWRDDGLAVAVEVSYDPPTGDNPGFGPPAYLVVIPVDGSATNAPRPKTPREQSRALNLDGMKLLKAGKLDDAQKQFVAAIEADPSFSIALYNLASVASLRKDSHTAVLAMDQVIQLARSDPEAKQALAKAKTDHDLDFIASQSPYVAKLLGRPRTKGDDWCIAAETRARDMNTGNFIGVAEEAAPVIDPGAHGGLPAGKDPEFSCTVSDGKSQFNIAMYVRVTAKNKTERLVRIAWELFPDGLFDADAFPDEKQTSRTIRLQKLEHVVRISKTIIGGK